MPADRRRSLRLSRIRILRPLRIRDFALLWSGMTVSLLGDGVYTVAIAWQVYQLSNAPEALSAVGVAWMLPQILLLLLGGAVSDRFERRYLLMLADGIRGSAIVVLGVLSVSGALRLWHVLVIVAVYGVGVTLFAPAFGAIVPDIVAHEELVEANSLGQFVRPLCVRFAGPALGGWIIAAFGTGQAFLFDAGTFAASAAAFLLMRTRSFPDAGGRARSSLGRDVREGLAFVRSQTWLWGTLLAVTLAMLFFLGPVYVLMPYVVKNGLHGGADGLGFVFSAGGAGAIAAALLVGQRGLPRRPLTTMYLAWAAAAFGLVGYAVAGAVWQAAAVSFLSVAGLTVGGIVWSTTLQRLVPKELLGRVSSVDWMLSFSLTPISYALVGPVADALGPDATLLRAGIASGCVLLAVLVFVPSIRATDARALAVPA